MNVTPTVATVDVTRTAAGIRFVMSASAPRSPSYVSGRFRFRACKRGAATAIFSAACSGTFSQSQKGTADVELSVGQLGGPRLCWGYASDVGSHPINDGGSVAASSTDGGSACQDFELGSSAYVAPWNPGQAFDLTRMGSASYDVVVEFSAQ